MARLIGTKKKDKLTGTSRDDFIAGNNGNDILDGSRGNDILYGGQGNDIIKGGLGNDKLFGDAGSDTLIGGDGDDFLNPGFDSVGDVVNGGAGIDTVSYKSFGNLVIAEVAINNSGLLGDTFIDVENIIGSNFNDFLQPGLGGFAYGGNGDDFLSGTGASNSSTPNSGTLRGDAGTDYLDMDNGATRAWLQNNLDEDRIGSFKEDEDKLFIKLSDFGLGDSLTAEEIVNGTSAVGVNAQFIYNSVDNRIYFDPDGTGDAAAESVAVFYWMPTISDNNLDVGDFEFIL